MAICLASLHRNMISVKPECNIMLCVNACLLASPSIIVETVATARSVLLPKESSAA